jgi:hypothetical protein
MTIEDIRRSLATFDEVQFSGGGTDVEIHRASVAIGLPFPPECREYLRTLGAGHVSSEEFIGLGGPRHLDVTWITEELRNRHPGGFPQTMIPIRADGFGNYDCIDTTEPTHDGEFQVVEWLHGRHGAETGRVVAGSFCEWFTGLLETIRRLDKEHGCPD